MKKSSMKYAAIIILTTLLSILVSSVPDAAAQGVGEETPNTLPLSTEDEQENYGITVASIPVTNANCMDILDDGGSVRYDPALFTLFFTEAYVKGEIIAEGESFSEEPLILRGSGYISGSIKCPRLSIEGEVTSFDIGSLSGEYISISDGYVEAALDIGAGNAFICGNAKVKLSGITSSDGHLTLMDDAFLTLFYNVYYLNVDIQGGTVYGKLENSAPANHEEAVTSLIISGGTVDVAKIEWNGRISVLDGIHYIETGGLLAQEIEISDSLIIQVPKGGQVLPNAEDGRACVYQADGVSKATSIVIKPYEPEPDAYTIKVTDYTKGKVTTSIQPEQLYSGNLIFTADCETSCVIARVTTDGYEEVHCSVVDGLPVYSLNVDQNIELVFALRGDTNLDGSIGTKDATFVRKLVAQVNGIESQLPNIGLSKIAGDANADGTLGTKDATAIRKIVAQVSGFSFPWENARQPEPAIHALFFDPTGGDLNEPRRFELEGSPYGELPFPNRCGYSFIGWYNEREGGIRVSDDTVMSAQDTTLYAHWTPIAAPEKGDILSFGRYGDKDIEWLVLDTDGSKAFLISRYALDARPFDVDSHSNRINWENCTLRAWLNEEFLLSVFREDIQDRILLTNIDSEANWCTFNTNDRIFLLNSQEAQFYFPIDDERKCSPTSYTQMRGEYSTDSVTGESICYWWLREVSYTSPLRVDNKGFITHTRIKDPYWLFGVRPVMWIDLSSWYPEGYRTLCFDPAGGAVKETLRYVKEGAPYGELPLPANSMKTFIGWFTAEEGGTQVFSTTAMEDHNVTLYAHWKTPEIGDCFSFGTYADEAIQWRLLSINGSKALVISQYGLDSKPYNTEYTDVTWETCSLRKWLNEEFLNAAFSIEEQDKILTTLVTADRNNVGNASPGNDTNDKLFLLSLKEVDRYYEFFGSDWLMCIPTPYAIRQEVYTYTPDGLRFYCGWWLRTPGSDSTKALCTQSYNGLIDSQGREVSSEGRAVRPAMWVEWTP